ARRRICSWRRKRRCGSMQPGAAMTRRLFVPPDRIAGDAARLLAADLHYLRGVLRLADGAPVEVFDGEGGAYDGVLEASGLVRLGPRRGAPPPRARVHLAFALARGDKV